MKPRNKKILIVVVTVYFLGPIIYFGFNYDYHFSRNFGLTKQTQKIFWRMAYKNKIEKAGGLDFQINSGGGDFHDGRPEPKSFDLILNDQWAATYNNDNRWFDDEDVFKIVLFNTEDGVDKSFTFYVTQKDLKTIKDDSKYRNNPKTYSNPTSPEERQQIDRETTPDSITDTDYLEKLALKKFVEFQDQYFGINN